MEQPGALPRPRGAFGLGVAGDRAVAAKAGFEVGYCLELIQQAGALPYQIAGEVAPSNVSGKVNYFMRKPVGVVSVISPWNFPYVLTLRAVAPALVHFIQDAELSREQIAELKKILDREARR